MSLVSGEARGASVNRVVLGSSSPLSFGVHVSRDGGRVVVAVVGDVDVFTAPTLSGVLRDLIDGQGNLAIEVDFGALEFIDTNGLGVLVDACKAARLHGGDLILRSVPRSARKAMELTGLLTVFAVDGEPAPTSERSSRVPR